MIFSIWLLIGFIDTMRNLYLFKHGTKFRPDVQYLLENFEPLMVFVGIVMGPIDFIYRKVMKLKRKIK